MLSSCPGRSILASTKVLLKADDTHRIFGIGGFKGMLVVFFRSIF
jgi:hypothetical protein